jgi:hypothetical protein
LDSFKVMFLRDKDWAQVVKTNHFLGYRYFTLWNLEREKRVNTQAKAISEVVKDFEQSLENLRPSTRRVYVAGARAVIRTAGLELWQSPSATDLLASIAKSPTEKSARIAPFLDFLGGGDPKQSLSASDSAALQNWVIQGIAKQMRLVRNPSIASRRDSGLIAALCAAPARGSPRKWPENCLKIAENEVLLWDAPIQEPCFAARSAAGNAVIKPPTTSGVIRPLRRRCPCSRRCVTDNGSKEFHPIVDIAPFDSIVNMIGGFSS